MCFAFDPLLAVDRVGVAGPEWRGETFFQGHFDAVFRPLETLQNSLFKMPLVPLGRYVAKGEENGITGVVMPCIKIPQPLIAQIRDRLGGTAAVEVIGVGREQFKAQAIPQCCRDR